MQRVLIMTNVQIIAVQHFDANCIAILRMAYLSRYLFLIRARTEFIN